MTYDHSACPSETQEAKNCALHGSGLPEDKFFVQDQFSFSGRVHLTADSNQPCGNFTMKRFPVILLIFEHVLTSKGFLAPTIAKKEYKTRK